MSTDYSSPDVRLLGDVVRALVRRHNISTLELERFSGREDRIWKIAFERACQLKPAALGRIICAVPQANLYGVHHQTWLGKHESGPYLLQQIAASAMICHMQHTSGVRPYVSLEVSMAESQEGSLEGELFQTYSEDLFQRHD